MTTLRKAAFLDRDGVINVDHGYVYRWEDFEFVPGAIAAMQRLQQAGYALVVVTNQSGIARGFYSEQDLLQLHQRLQACLAAQGIELAAIEFCPHLPQGQVAAYRQLCDCRKPAPGMILRAAERLQLDLAASLMFGDKLSDVEAGLRAGVGRTALLSTNAQGEPESPSGAISGVVRYRGLAEAVSALLATS